MPIVCGVKFRGAGKVYYFAPGDVPDLQANDHVIVETARGKEMGQLAMAPREVSDSEIVGQLKPILHRAMTADLLDAQRFQNQEAEAVAKCAEEIGKFNLPMKIVSAEYNYDGTRLTFFFTSEQRVDFRELVRELAHVFRTRIELRQIGVRDEAKIVGGMGKCGRPLCCATWLSEFCPVSIRMAKLQDLPLSPMEISGLCGRLLCCLAYENDYYQQVKSRFPKVGKSVDTPYGPGKVIKVSALRETMSVLYEDGSIREMTLEEFQGQVPPKESAEPGALNETQRRTLGMLLEPSASDVESTDDWEAESRVTANRTPAAEPAGSAAKDPETPQPAGPARSRDRRRPRQGTESRDARASSNAMSSTPPQNARRAEGGRRSEEEGSTPGQLPGRKNRGPKAPRPALDAKPDQQPLRGPANRQSPSEGEAGNRPGVEKRASRPRRRRTHRRENTTPEPGEGKPSEE